MKRTAILAALLLGACDSGVDQELASLRAEIERQQAEIDQLSAFVDSQGEVLRTCQTALVELTDYLLNSNAIGMFREAGSQVARFGECTDALERFNAIAKGEPLPPAASK